MQEHQTQQKTDPTFVSRRLYFEQCAPHQVIAGEYVEIPDYVRQYFSPLLRTYPIAEFFDLQENVFPDC